MEDLRNLRDEQEEIPCEDDECLCQHFDLIIDKIETLKDKFDKKSVQISNC